MNHLRVGTSGDGAIVVSEVCVDGAVHNLPLGCGKVSVEHEVLVVLLVCVSGGGEHMNVRAKI